MGGIVKSISSAVIGKRAAKKAFLAQERGIFRAIDEQENIFKDTKERQEDVRDSNISDIENLRDTTLSEYDDTFSYVNDLLQDQYDTISDSQGLAFDTAENRLVQSLEDALKRSQESFDYASQNLMPYIQKGREAFDSYVQKANEGFEFDYKESPAYQFIKDSALNASTNTAAASGMGLSGATQKALADRAANLAATDYDNQYRRAYNDYRDDLNTLSSLGNIGLQGDQQLINREQSLANFEVQARNQLNNALNANDFARANAIAENILRLTGGQGELASQAFNIKNQINSSATNAINQQRQLTAGNIDQTQLQTGTNISNFNVDKGNAEANYNNQRGKLQSDLVNSTIDGGIVLASAIAGGAGALGGAGGFSGALQGANFGSQLSNFGSGSQFSPQQIQSFSQPQAVAQPQYIPQSYGGGLQLGQVNYSGSNVGGIGSSQPFKGMAQPLQF